MVKVAAVVPAAGRSARMGLAVKKQFFPLEGIPVIGRTLEVLAASSVIDSITLVTGPGEDVHCGAMLVEQLGIPKVAAIVPGGSERQESVFNGLLALSADTGIVVIHDGARPLLRTEALAAVVDAALEHGAATMAVPVKDTVKLGNGNDFVAETLPRERLWLAQTPQAFRYPLILEAHQWAAKAKYTGTDDAGLVEMLGQPVKIVTGSYENLKITTPEDLFLASAIIRARASIE